MVISSLLLGMALLSV